MTYLSQHIDIVHLVSKDSTKLSFTSLYIGIHSETPFKYTIRQHISEDILLLERSDKSKKIS